MELPSTRAWLGLIGQTHWPCNTRRLTGSLCNDPSEFHALGRSGAARAVTTVSPQRKLGSLNVPERRQPVCIEHNPAKELLSFVRDLVI